MPTPVPANQICTIQMTALDGALVSILLREAVDQYNHASYEERNDPTMKLMHESYVRLITVLPTCEGM